MTLTEQIKILDGKVNANKGQYDLDREAAKIFALSSGDCMLLSCHLHVSERIHTL